MNRIRTRVRSFTFAVALIGAFTSVAHAQRLGTESGSGTAHPVSGLGRVELSGDSVWRAGATGLHLDDVAWRFRVGDELAWTSPGFYDADWTPFRPQDAMPDTVMSAARDAVAAGAHPIAWFRLPLKIDQSLVRRPLMLRITTHGAAEIYVDGELVHSTGGMAGANDGSFISPPLPIPVTFSNTNPVIAIRYDVGTQLRVVRKIAEPDFFHVSIGNAAALVGDAATWRRNAAIELALFGLFAAIGLLYLLLYALLRRPVTNLYFAVFALLFALNPLSEYLSLGLLDYRMSLVMNQVTSSLLGVGLLALFAFLYEVFFESRPRTFWAVAVLCVIWSLTQFLVPPALVNRVLATILLLLCVEGIRIVAYSVWQRHPGARLLGVGCVVTFGALIYFALSLLGLVPASDDVNWLGWIGVLASSTIYLARNFARSVHESEQMATQLAESNRSLELKVAERTQALEQQMSREQKRATEQEALVATSRDLSGELELDRLLTSVLKRAVSLLDVTGGELAIYHEDARELEVVASYNLGQDSTGTRLLLGEGAMGQAAQRREPIIIGNYSEWDARSEKYATSKSVGVMAAPLLIGDRLVGALASVHDRPDREFGAEDLRLLTMFAPQAAIAIENARLYSEAQKGRKYFEAVVENSPVAIVAIDLAGNVTSLNPAFENLFGYTRAEALHCNLDALISTADTYAQALAYTHEAVSGRTTVGMGRRRRKDNSFVDVEIAAIPVEVDGELVGLLAMYHDVTELLRARMEAEAANTTKSQFLANMSHELRTPLNAIIGYSEMLVEEAQDSGDDAYVPDLRKIHTSGKHLLGLINDILDLSKIESGRMDLYLETFNIASLIDEVAATVRPLVEKNGNVLAVRLPADIGTMRSDQVKVRQILFNLLSNASKFTERGTVSIEAERVAASDSAEQIVLRVRDSGIGMTQDQIHKIFRPFTQADASTTKKYGGTGLGLAITKRFCEMMGGTVNVESEADVGTTFIVTLPVQVSTTSEMQTAPDDADAVDRLGAPLVLVIDDDASAREMLTRMLLKEGYRVLSASGGEEGLRIAGEELPDVITLDVLMAGMDGWGVLSRLKADEATAGIPVVVLTVIDDRNLGFALGAADYVTKPVDRERLADVLRRVRADGRDGPVLLVEDDAGTREMLRRILERDGWTVAEAENGRVGLERVAEVTPALVLLDLMMPEMDGFEFVDELRRTRAGQRVPVVVLTAKTLTSDERTRLQGAVARVFEKSNAPSSEVLAEIRRLLDRVAHRAPAGP